MLRALLEYRHLIAGLLRRDFQVRSVRAMWGNAWLVIQPGAQILIYTVIFAEVLRAKLPGVDDRFAYGLYLCAGLITWNYFSEIITRSQTLFLDNADLLKTVRFPRVTLPVALFASATINFAIVAGIFLGVLLVTDHWPGAVLVSLLPLVGIVGLLGLGIGVLTGTLNVFYRDVGYVVGVVLQFWFWLTPIVYPISIVPETARHLFRWNPMYPVVSGFQRVVVQQAPPEWSGVAIVGAVALVTALVGWGVFRALSPDLVDEL